MFKKNNAMIGLKPIVIRSHSKDCMDPNYKKERKLEAVALKQLNDSESQHSSVYQQSNQSSIRNMVNSSYFHSEVSFKSARSVSIDHAKNTLQHNKPKYLEEKQLLISSPNKKVLNNEKSSKMRSLRSQQILTKEEQLERLFSIHHQRSFIRNLLEYLSKNWTEKEAEFQLQNKTHELQRLLFQKINIFSKIIEDFLTLEHQNDHFNSEEKKHMIQILFKESGQLTKELQKTLINIIKKIPSEQIIEQELMLEELFRKILQIYDPKYIYSKDKIKERFNLYYEEYVSKRNNLKAGIIPKLKNNLDFLEEIQKYFNSYQKELQKLKNQVSVLEQEKIHTDKLLEKKSLFNHIEINYQRLNDIKEKANSLIKNDLEINIVKYHEKMFNDHVKVIDKQIKENQEIKIQLEHKRSEVLLLENKISDWLSKIPKKSDMETQVFFITEKKHVENSGGSTSDLQQFLENVVTPFSFSQKITSALLNILTIDKILFDYEIIKNKLSFHSFMQFLFQWFIIRTGCKKISQIFIKNFLYSLKELRSKHKRFNIFNKICGYNNFRKKNMQEDLQFIFFQTKLAWYYLLKLALMYRKKLNENPTGFHIFPPIQCEQIFKLPLRKIYELVQQFFISEDIEVPKDLSQKIDYYSINEISKFKSKDEAFQKEILQEIHILREINYDIVAGFVLEYISKNKCQVLEKLLRTIHAKQKEDHTALAYSQFEVIYRKFYKEKRSKIEYIYSKLCQINQHDMLDVENIQPVAFAILEDQIPLRNCFQRIQFLKPLFIQDKSTIMTMTVKDKKNIKDNAFEVFKEKFYHEFYDFYHTTSFLEEIFKIIRNLIKKRLKRYTKEQKQIQQMVKINENIPIYSSTSVQRQKKSNENQDEDEDSEQEEQQVENQKETEEKSKLDQNSGFEITKKKDQLILKLEEWNKIIVRVPHFTSKVLTIDQIVVHNMRRKEMIEASEFAWRTMREILCILGKY